MVRTPPAHWTIALIVALALGFAGWTASVLAWSPLAAVDRRLAPPAIGETTPAGEIASAFALLTWPGVLYAGVLGVAIWAFRRRLRRLAVGLLLVVVFAWGGVTAVKYLVRRPRPVQALDVITSHGWAYPSGHVTAAAACAIAVGATFAVTRQSVRAKLGWQVGAGIGLVLVAVNRWVMGAHWVSDLVGGVLLGALAATAALLLAGVKVSVPQDLVTDLVRTLTPAPPPPDVPPRRCAVIYNPAKVTDWVTFRRHVEYELRTRGWQRPLWLETTEDDPGRALTRQAVAEQVDLVLGAGGDGTVRVICDGLAGTGIPLGLIPAGTGNLLARNIGIPLDEAAALDVAFDGVDRPLDLIRLSVDDSPPERFAVMAGIGIDAVIMQATRPELKKAVGSAAYFVSAAQNANHPPLQATIQVDDDPPFRRKAHLIVIGNVGFLQANIHLIPDAQPDDGLLDLLVASPRRVADWVRLTTRVLTRRDRPDEQLDRLTGTRVRITVDHPDQYQMDGDTVGECTSMTAEVEPGALTLRVPRGQRRAAEAVAADVVPVDESGVIRPALVGASEAAAS